MHILHVLPSLDPITGGPSRSVPKICEAFAKMGNEVTLFTTVWPKKVNLDDWYAIEKMNGFWIRRFPCQPNIFTSNLPRSKNLLTAVKDTLKEFDIAFIHSLWNPVASLVMRELRRKGSRYCLMPHGMLDPLILRRNRWKKLPWLYLWERSNVEGASLIIFNTEAEKEKAQMSYWRFQKTFVLPHIIELADWKDLPCRSRFEAQYPQVKGRDVILYIGRINWVKNLDKLVEALSIIHRARPSAMLACVGPDNEGTGSKLEKQARSLGVHESLLFTGIMDKEGLKKAYARGDVLALVSQKENFGLVVAEALASGLPVVLSEGVDVGKCFPSGGPVCCVKPEPKEIAEAILRMLERSASKGLPDEEARTLAERMWGNPHSSVQQLLETFQEIIGDPIRQTRVRSQHTAITGQPSTVSSQAPNE